MTITDEYTGAWLAGIAFPYFMVSQVPLKEFQEALIGVFKRWGKAGAFRVDNGAPLGNPRMSSISAIPLWLISMDIDMIWNKPRSPQSNGKVERMQGTSARWVVLDNCDNLEALQSRLTNESEVQRKKFPVKRLKQKTILEVYPELEASRRIYREEDFDERRAYKVIARAVYNRSSDKGGVVRLYMQDFNLSTKNAKRQVQVRLCAETLVWKFYDGQELLAEKAATHLSADRIKNLTACLKI